MVVNQVPAAVVDHHLAVPQAHEPVPRQALAGAHRLGLELLVPMVEGDTTAEEQQHPTLPVEGHRKDLLQ